MMEKDRGNRMNVSEMSDHDLMRAIGKLRGISHDAQLFHNWPVNLNAAVDLLKDMPGYRLEYDDELEWYISCGSGYYGKYNASAARVISEAYVLMHVTKDE